MRIHCPICKTVRDAPEDFAARPFCSARCKLVDLSHWLNESYRIPTSERLDESEDDVQPN